MQERNVADRIKHPEYKLPSRYHDIALLRLDKPLELGPEVRPACLDVEEIPVGKSAIASGFGKTAYGSFFQLVFSRQSFLNQFFSFQLLTVNYTNFFCLTEETFLFLYIIIILFIVAAQAYTLVRFCFLFTKRMYNNM